MKVRFQADADLNHLSVVAILRRERAIELQTATAARLAGLPEDIIARARELLTELEGTHTGGGEGLGRWGDHRPASEPPLDQLSFFAHGEHPVVKRLRAVDPNTMTPREALNLLFELMDETR